VITDVAEQTKFLALNTTIEVAWAGDAGTGFQVVANEVKNLAHETATSAKEITSQIKKIQTSGQQTVSAITDMVKIIH
jgi:methyl-accepting chemotaxis protein